MKTLLLIIVASSFFVSAQGQTKQEFQKQLQIEREKIQFKKQLLEINEVSKKGLNEAKIDSLKHTGNFEFLTFKSLPTDPQAKTRRRLKLDLPQFLATYYLQLETAGLINNLKLLRASGNLTVPSRNIASDVELPQKKNRSQSYNDFYLEVIQNLMKANKTVLSADQLDFKAYQSWEEEEKLLNESDIRTFRATFIIFLYRHYHLNK